MDDTSLFPLLMIGAGIGADPFARAPRATRMHPRRDDDGHPGAAAVDDGAEDDIDDWGPDDQDSDDRDDDQDSEDTEQLGDPGKRALDAMKAKLKAEKAKRVAAEASALAKANTRIVKAEIRAAAAGKLADPADALNVLDLEHFEVDDDGEVNRDEIAQAIADLLETKPYLAAHGGGNEKNKPPKPDRSQGAGGKGTSTTEQQFISVMAPLL